MERSRQELSELMSLATFFLLDQKFRAQNQFCFGAQEFGPPDNLDTTQLTVLCIDSPCAEVYSLTRTTVGTSPEFFQITFLLQKWKDLSELIILATHFQHKTKN